MFCRIILAFFSSILDIFFNLVILFWKNNLMFFLKNRANIPEGGISYICMSAKLLGYIFMKYMYIHVLGKGRLKDDGWLASLIIHVH